MSFWQEVTCQRQKRVILSGSHLSMPKTCHFDTRKSAWKSSLQHVLISQCRSWCEVRSDFLGMHHIHAYKSHKPYNIRYIWHTKSGQTFLYLARIYNIHYTSSLWAPDRIRPPFPCVSYEASKTVSQWQRGYSVELRRSPVQRDQYIGWRGIPDVSPLLWFTAGRFTPS